MFLCTATSIPKTCRCFLVHDKEQFEANVLPFYFRQSKFSSFQRQLNLYGYKRMSAVGPDKGAYYHPLFLRSKPDLAARILRTKIKNTGPRKPANLQSEPKFYSMKFLPEEKVEDETINKSPYCDETTEKVQQQTNVMVNSPKNCFTQTSVSPSSFQVGLRSLLRLSAQSPTASPLASPKSELWSPNRSGQRNYDRLCLPSLPQRRYQLLRLGSSANSPRMPGALSLVSNENVGTKQQPRWSLELSAAAAAMPTSLTRVVTPTKSEITRSKELLADQYFLASALRMKKF